MKKVDYFKTPLWVEDRPEYLKSLTKHTDAYIKNARKKNKEYIKHFGDFGISHHSTPLTVDNI